MGPRNERVVPLGTLYLTSVLEKNGYTVDFRDYQLNKFENPYSIDSFLSFLKGSAKVIGIGCMFNLMPLVLLSLEKLKKDSPEKVVILGGPGPSGVPERILENFPSVNIIVRGEGEKTIVELMDSLDGELSNVRGICYRKEDRVIINAPQKRIENLDEVPFPAYHRIDFQDYTRVGIMTSRGCPYHCTFCEVAPLWGNLNYKRSVQNVLDELKVLRYKYKIKRICMNDDLFVLSKKRTLQFCRELREEDIDLHWDCLGRIDLMDEEIMDALSRSGCDGIQYGIESGNDAILKKINKGFTMAEAERVINKSTKYFDHVVCTFIWGFPFETMEDFYHTLFFISKIGQKGARSKLMLLSPAPLSQIYREYGYLIRFSNELISDLVWKGYENWEKKKIVKMIKAYPEIFPDFYYYHSANLNEKRALLKKVGLIV